MYTLMQMNLFLSGLADCYVKLAYAAAVAEAASLLRKARPDAVTFNEACRAGVARIALRTGYRLRFSRRIYRGRTLDCVDPWWPRCLRGRGARRGSRVSSD